MIEQGFIKVSAPVSSWRVCSIPSRKQQDGTSCGLFVINNTAHILKDETPTLSQRCVPAFRRKLHMQLKAAPLVHPALPSVTSAGLGSALGPVSTDIPEPSIQASTSLHGPHTPTVSNALPGRATTQLVPSCCSSQFWQCTCTCCPPWAVWA